MQRLIDAVDLLTVLLTCQTFICDRGQEETTRKKEKDSKSILKEREEVMEGRLGNKRRGGMVLVGTQWFSSEIDDKQTESDQKMAQGSEHKSSGFSALH